LKVADGAGVATDVAETEVLGSSRAAGGAECDR